IVSGTATIADTSSPTTGVTVAAGDTVTLRWTISNGSCTDSTDDVVLTNDALPTTAAAGTDQTQCNTSGFTMAANTPTVGTGLWSIVSGTATITDTSSPTTGVTVAAGDTVTLRWTISNGSCTDSTDDVVLTNDALPTTAAAGTDQTQCNTSGFTMAANTPTVGTGLWSIVSGTATIADTSSPTTGVTVAAGDTVTLRWTISNGSCTDSTDDVVLTNDALPTTAAAGTDQTQCNTSGFTMAANTPTVGTGLWSIVSGTATIADTSSPTTGVTVAAGDTVTLRWTISNGSCTDSTDDVVLTNDALPTTAAAGTDQTQCNTSGFTMAANTPTVGTGIWSIVSGAATIADTSSPTTGVTVAAGDTVTLRWTISNGSCTDSTDDVVLT
ncbi:hypothetical protein SLH33_12930, partial [Tenacibaculum sp. IB213877]|nr:hypothetical protein [Tenacibaculum sp. IB213877]